MSCASASSRAIQGTEHIRWLGNGKHVLQPLTKPIESVSSRIRPIILPARDEEPDFGGRQHSYGYHNNLMAARVRGGDDD